MRTVNVRSEDDAKLMAALQSEVFQKGLNLISSVGPAVGLLSATLGSIARYIAAGAKNRSVQQGLMAAGFDLELVDEPKLRPGTYIMAQAPAEVQGMRWSWGNYVYDRQQRAIVDARDRATLIGYNYVAIGIKPTAR
jgi:hypothetical protein